MKQFVSLLWKEWYETRVLFGIALFVFLGLPLIGGAEQYRREHLFHISASVWAYYLGGLLAIFIGVGTVARDFGGGLEDFWRSRPVGIGRWLLVKYFVGLLATLVPLYLPLLLQTWINRVDTELVVEPRFILAWCPFEWAALYSIGFLSASLLRRAAHAAMLAVALGLLLYFLPEVFPPLRFLGLGRVIDESQFPHTGRGGHILPIYHRTPWAPGNVPFEPGQLTFVLGMLVLCAVTLGLAMLTVGRDWRVESSRKLIYWSIGGALLLVFSSAAFSVQSNLPLLETLDLPAPPELGPPEFGGYVLGDGTTGVMVRDKWIPSGDHDAHHDVLRSLRLTSSGIELGPPAVTESNLWRPVLWQPQHPDVLYTRQTWSDNLSETEYPILVTVTLHGSSAAVFSQSFPELTIHYKGNSAHWWSGGTIIWHDRLYLLGPKLLIFDLADPSKPHLVSTESIAWTSYRHNPAEQRLLNDSDDVETGSLSLPPVAQLPARQRLELAEKDWPDGAILDGDVLVRIHNDHLTTYHLDQLTDTAATFRKLGRYDPTPIDKLLGYSQSNHAHAPGLLFQSLGQSKLGGAHITVFDISGPRPYPVGHFALPFESYLHSMLPLPDGRLMVMGHNKLYLLGAPPVRK